MILPSEEYSSFKEEEDLYYYLTLNSLLQGLPLQELNSELYFQEDLENYAACSGIKKAIEESEYKTYKELKAMVILLDEKYNF